MDCPPDGATPRQTGRPPPFRYTFYESPNSASQNNWKLGLFTWEFEGSNSVILMIIENFNVTLNFLNNKLTRLGIRTRIEIRNFEVRKQETKLKTASWESLL